MVSVTVCDVAGVPLPSPLPVTFSLVPSGAALWFGTFFGTNLSAILHDPGLGKKFTLLGYSISVPQGATAAAAIILLEDGAAVFMLGQPINATAAAANNLVVDLSSIGGYVSTTAANKLNYVISAAPSSSIAVNAWGYDI